MSFAVLPSKIRLGDVLLDTVQQELIQADQRITLEPKVFEVLCYLMAHRDRYVSLTELHDAVWQGRVVSDTAVRRAVSKLRTVLQDNDLQQPQFIRSGMKRGYQWMVAPVAVDNTTELAVPLAAANSPVNLAHSSTTTNGFSTDFSTTSNAAASTLAHVSEEAAPSSSAAKQQISPAPIPNQAVQAGVSNTSTAKSSWRNFALVGALCTALLACGALLLVDKPWSNVPADQLSAPAAELDVLLNIPGMKSLLATSRDGQQQAFMAMIEGQFNLYLFNRSNNALHKIRTPGPSNSIYFAEFTPDNKYLLFGGFGQVPAYFLQPLADLTAEPLLIDTRIFSKVEGSPLVLSAHDFILSGTRNPGESGTYQRYNFTTQQWSAFTHNHQVGELDLKARLSPDGSKVAMFRLNNNPVPSTTVQVYQRESAELLYSHTLNQYFFNLEWLDEKQLVLTPARFSPQLFRLDLLTGHLSTETVQHAFAETRRSTGPNEWFAIVAPDVKPPRFQLATLSNMTQEQQIFNLPGKPLDLAFSQVPGQLLLTEYEDKQFKLSLFDTKTGTKTLYLSHQDRFRVLQPHSEKPLILLQSDRLLLLDTTHGTLQQVTSKQQKVQDGYFHAHDNAIYFTEQISDQWRVSKYDLDNRQTSLVATGYRYLHRWQDTYAAVDGQGQFWLLDYRLIPDRKLPLKLPGDFFYARLFLQGDTLTVTELTKQLTWRVHQVDLVKSTRTHSDLPVNPVRVPDAISVKDGQILFANWLQVSSPVVRLPGPPIPLQSH